MTIERISAITLKVTDMARSVRFYNDLGLEVIYGGKHAAFTSLQTAGAQDAILNLERGACTSGWGRIVFHVKDVDDLWGYLKASGFNAPRPVPGDYCAGRARFQQPEGRMEGVHRNGPGGIVLSRLVDNGHAWVNFCTAERKWLLGNSLRHSI